MILPTPTLKLSIVSMNLRFAKLSSGKTFTPCHHNIILYVCCYNIAVVRWKNSVPTW